MSRPEPIWERIRLANNSFPAWFLLRYRAAKDHPAKLRIWRWLYALAGQPEVLVHYARRARMRLNLVDGVQSSIATEGYYEPEVWDTLADFATGNDVVWDIGAHVGGVAIRAALDPRVRAVHCFEPNPHTAARLAANLALNPTLTITLHQVALGDRTETRTLYFGPPGNIGQTSLVVRPTEDGTSVQCVTADEWIATGKAERPTLLKVDVEGFEASVFAGATAELTSGQIKAIVFESAADSNGGILSQELVDLLASYGYRTRYLPRPHGSVEGNENYLATRD